MKLDPNYSQENQGPQVITSQGQQFLTDPRNNLLIALPLSGYPQSNVGDGICSIVDQITTSEKRFQKVVEIGSGRSAASLIAGLSGAAKVTGVDIDRKVVEESNRLLKKFPELQEKVSFYFEYFPEVIESLENTNLVIANLFQEPGVHGSKHQKEILTEVIQPLVRKGVEALIKEASYAPSLVSKSGKYLANKGFKIVGKGEAIVDNPRHKEAVNQKTALEKALIEYYLLKKT